MNLKRLIVVLILSVAPCFGTVIDHTSVNLYTQIPNSYIDVIKTMWLDVAGESHSQSLGIGCQLLSAADSRFPAVWTQTGNPEFPTNHLRVSRATWGDIDTRNRWRYYYGEEDFFTSDTAVSYTKEHLAYINTNGYGKVVFGFGWCGDMYTGSPSGGIDPVYYTRWGGASVGGPDGDLSWGLDAGDYVLTSNRVCMDTYLSAVLQYITFCSNNGYTTKVIFNTGPVDWADTENGYQRQLKNNYIRDFVRNNPQYTLLDWADILAWNDTTEYTRNWVNRNGQTVSFQQIHPDNMLDLNGSYAEDGDHIGEVGAVRLAKAAWVMMASLQGWDGVSTNNGTTNPPPTVNLAPILTPSTDKTMVEGGQFVMNVVATDPEGQPLTYSLLTSPGSMTISSVGVINWSAGLIDVPSTNYTITVKVSDNGSPVMSSTNSFTLTVTNNPVPVVVVNDSPKVFLPMDEGVNNVAFDVSGNGVNGILNGSTWTSGWNRYGVYFDGIDDYVNIGTNTLSITDDYSVSMWVNCAVNNRAMIFMQRGRNMYPFSISLEAGGRVRFGFRFGSSSATIYSTRSLSTNVWYNIATVYRAVGEQVIYVNGVEEGRGTRVGASPFPTADPIQLGINPVSNYNPFMGSIDNVKIYNRALTLTEVQNNYNVVYSGTTPPGSGGGTITNLPPVIVPDSTNLVVDGVMSIRKIVELKIPMSVYEIINGTNHTHEAFTDTNLISITTVNQ